MTDIAQLGIQINSSTAPKAVKELDALTVSAGKAEGASQKLGAESGVLAGKLQTMAAATGAAGKASGYTSHGMKMLAYQLNQVGQMGAVTGNYMNALAIQIPDITASFGFLGAMLGGVAAFALPALIGMLTGASEEAKGLRRAVEGLVESADAYIAAAEAASVSTASLAEKYGVLATEARGALQAIKDVALVDAMTATQDAISGVSDALTRGPIHILGEQFRQLRDEAGLTEEQARSLVNTIMALERAEGLTAQAKEAARLREQMLSVFGSLEAMPPAYQQAYRSLATITLETSAVNNQTRTAIDLLRTMGGAAGGVASAVSSIGAAASDAYGPVADLAAKMWEAAQARVQMLKDSSLNYGKVANAGGVDAIARAGNQAMGQDIDGEMTGGAGGAYRATGGGGGGGGGSDPFKSDLEALIENLRTEREIEDEWYQENLAILQDRRAQEIMGKQAHDAALVSLHEEYQRRIAEIDATAQQQRLGEMAGFFGALASVAQAGGQRMAKIAAAAGAVEGTINAYRAALQALADPSIGFWGKAAAYASVLAAGLKGVAAIRSAGGIGGGGGGGRGSIAAQGAGGQQAQAAEFRIYGFGRDKSYTGAELEQIFDGLHEVGKRRGIPVPTVVFV